MSGTRLTLNIKFIFIALIISFFNKGYSSDFDLSGKFRLRTFHYNGYNEIPDYLTGPGFKQVTFSDIFYRNKLLFSPEGKLQIVSMVDIYTVAGSNDGEMNSSDLGFQVRNLYAIWNRGSLGIWEAGFQPFLIADGRLLAANGAGIKYKYPFLFLPVSASFFWLKTLDKSLQNINGGIGKNDYLDSDIISSALNFSLKQNTFEIFYLRANKLIQGDFKLNMNWLGLQNISKAGKFINKTNIIINNGNLLNQVSSIKNYIEYGAFFYSSNEVKLNHFLFSFNTSGSSGFFNNSLKHRFFHIQPSFSSGNILFSDSGGIAVLSKNYSGLIYYSFTGEFYYSFTDFSFALIHAREIRDFSKVTNYFAHEADFNVKMHSIYPFDLILNSACLFPGNLFYETFRTYKKNHPLWEFSITLTYSY